MHRNTQPASRNRAAKRFVNANVRTISRVVVHPQFRSVGLAVALVRCLIGQCETRYVEALAVMGVWAENDPVSALLTPTLILAVPLFDIAFVGIVRVAQGKERDQALYFDQMTMKLPIGLGRDKEALYANLEFLDGTRGAPVNITGISGVGTKTITDQKTVDTERMA